MNQRDNRTHRKQNKDKVIMIVSSAFVLMALTMTGIYMKDKEEKNLDEDYTIDFTAEVEDEEEEFVMLEEPVEDSLENPSQSVDSGQVSIPGVTDGTLGMEAEIGQQVLEDMLAGLEDGTLFNGSQVLEESEEIALIDEELLEEEEILDGSDSVVSKSVEVVATPTFSVAEGLLMPVDGMVLMEFSPAATIYFATLDQFKYNTALVISTREGNPVKSCADGKVLEIGSDAEIGNYLKMDLGNGYVATYGQLKEIRANVGDTLDSGVAFATVAAPTKYYSVEGSNLYFKVELNGVATDPEAMFR